MDLILSCTFIIKVSRTILLFALIYSQIYLPLQVKLKSLNSCNSAKIETLSNGISWFIPQKSENLMIESGLGMSK